MKAGRSQGFKGIVCATARRHTSGPDSSRLRHENQTSRWIGQALVHFQAFLIYEAVPRCYHPR
jgi:hypothetical protein